MTRTRRLGRVGGLAASGIAAVPFVYLWVATMRSADDPLTVRARLDMAIWMTVFGTSWMVAAWLLWRAWWRRAGPTLAPLDGPGWLVAAGAATLPADRRHWGAAMAAELAQVQGRGARWWFAAGCARAAVLPPGGHRAAVGVAGALAVAATAAAVLVAGAVLPAGRVFALSSWGWWAGWAPWRWPGRAGCAGPGRARRSPGWRWWASPALSGSPPGTWPSTVPRHWAELSPAGGRPERSWSPGRLGVIGRPVGSCAAGTAALGPCGSRVPCCAARTGRLVPAWPPRRSW